MARWGKCHDTEGEVQAVRVEDHGGVKPFDGRFVREPGDGIAELCVMADGKGEEMCQSGLGVFGCFWERDCWLPWVHRKSHPAGIMLHVTRTTHQI